MSRPRKAEPLWHFLDIFHANLHVAVTRRELRRMLKTFTSMDDPVPRGPAAATSGHVGTTDGAESYHVVFWIDRRMWRRAGSDRAKLAGICAHEAAHGAGMIWNHIGATINHDTLRDDEPLAYLVGWLTEWLFDATVKERVG